MTRLHELVDLAVPAAALAVAVLVNRFDSDDRMAWLVFALTPTESRM